MKTLVLLLLLDSAVIAQEVCDASKNCDGQYCPNLCKYSSSSGSACVKTDCCKFGNTKSMTIQQKFPESGTRSYNLKNLWDFFPESGCYSSLDCQIDTCGANVEDLLLNPQIESSNGYAQRVTFTTDQLATEQYIFHCELKDSDGDTIHSSDSQCTTMRVVDCFDQLAFFNQNAFQDIDITITSSNYNQYLPFVYTDTSITTFSQSLVTWTDVSSNCGSPSSIAIYFSGQLNGASNGNGGGGNAQISVTQYPTSLLTITKDSDILKYKLLREGRHHIMIMVYNPDNYSLTSVSSSNRQIFSNGFTIDAACDTPNNIMSTSFSTGSGCYSWQNLCLGNQDYIPSGTDYTYSPYQRFITFLTCFNDIIPTCHGTYSINQLSGPNALSISLDSVGNQAQLAYTARYLIINPAAVVKDTWTFNLEVTKAGDTFASPSPVAITDTFTFKIKCCQYSIQITAPTITTTQFVDIGSTSTTAFQFPVFTQSPASLTADCPIQSYAYETATTDLQNPALSSGTYKVVPTDVNLHKQYIFKIVVTAEGGASVTTSSLYLNAGCGPWITMTYPTIASADRAFDVYVSAGSSFVKHFFTPSCSKSYCRATHYEIVDLVDTGTSNPITTPNGMNDVIAIGTLSTCTFGSVQSTECVPVTIDQASMIGTFKFKIKFYIEMNGVPSGSSAMVISEEFSATLSCTLQTNEVVNEVTPSDGANQIYRLDGTTPQFKFQAYSFTPAICEIVSYWASSSSGSYTDHPKLGDPTNPSSDGTNWVIDAPKVKETHTFYIQVISISTFAITSTTAYTLDVRCDNDQSTPTLQFKSFANAVQYVSHLVEANVKYTFLAANDKVFNNDYHADCPITSYGFTTTTAVEIDASSISSPIWDSGSISIVPKTARTSHRSYSFTLQGINDEGGKVTAGVNSILYVGCGNWVTSLTTDVGFTTSTFNLNPATGAVSTQSVQIFTVSFSYCDIVRFEIINEKFTPTATGTVQTSPGLLKFSDTSSTATPQESPVSSGETQKLIEVPLNTKGTFTFQIRQYISPGKQGSVIYHTNPSDLSQVGHYFDSASSLTLNVQCGSSSVSLLPVTSSTSIPDLTQFPSSTQQTQLGYVNANNNKFEFKAYTTTSSDCPVTDIIISSSPSADVAVPGLVFTYYSSKATQVITLANNAVKAVHVFYIHAMVEGQTTSLKSSVPFTFQIECNAASATLTQPDITDTTIFRALQTRYLAGTVAQKSFLMPAFTSSTSECPVNDYKFFSNKNMAASAEIFTLTSIPVDSTNQEIYIYDTQTLTAAQTQSFFLRAIAEGGASLDLLDDKGKTYELILRQGCDPSWTFIQTPTSSYTMVSSTEYTYTQAQFVSDTGVTITPTPYEQQIEGEAAYESKWKVNHPDCPIAQFLITETSENSKIESFNNYICSPQPCLTIGIKDRVFYYKSNYEFELTAIQEGGFSCPGSKSDIDKYQCPTLRIIITVSCGPNSVVISQVTPPALVADQTGDANVQKDIKFTGIELQTTRPGTTTVINTCPIQDIEISCTDGSQLGNAVTAMSSDLVHNFKSNNKLDVKTFDKTKVKKYEFYVHAYTQGGGHYWSPKYSLDVVCGPTSLRPQSSDFIHPTTLPVTLMRKNVGSVARYTYSEFTTALTDCPIISAQTQYVMSEGDPLAFDSISGGIVTVKPQDENKHMQYKFKIKLTAMGGSTYTYPDEITLQIGCGQWVTITEASVSYLISNYAATKQLYDKDQHKIVVEFEIAFDDTAATLDIPQFTTDISYCPITGYELHLTANGNNQYNEARLYPDLATHTIKGKVSGAYNTVYATTLFVMAKTGADHQGLFTQLISTWKIRFRIRCRAMRVISMPQSNGYMYGDASTNYQTQQISSLVNQANLDFSYQFYETDFKCTQTPCIDCTIDSFEISSQTDAAGVVTAHNLLSSIDKSGTLRTIKIDRHYIWDYKFYVIAKTIDTENNNRMSFKYSELVTVSIVCGSETISVNNEVPKETIKYGTPEQQMDVPSYTFVYPLAYTNIDQYLENNINTLFESSIKYDDIDPYQPPYPLFAQGQEAQMPCDQGKGYFILANGATDLQGALNGGSSFYISRQISSFIQCDIGQSRSKFFGNLPSGSTAGQFSCFCRRECGIVDYRFYSDPESKNLWSNQDVVPDIPGDKTTNYLQIQNAKLTVRLQETQVIKIYVKAISQGQQTNTDPLLLKIVICGTETLSARTQELFISLSPHDEKALELSGDSHVTKENKNSVLDTEYVIKYSNYSTWFQVQSTDEYASCDINRYYLHTKETCLIEDLLKVGGTVTLQQSNPTTNEEFIKEHLGHDLKVSTLQSSSGTVYLCAHSKGGIKVKNKITYSICGNEEVTLTDSSSKIQLEYYVESNQGRVRIDKSKFTSFFTSSDVLCPIKTYGLVTLIGDSSTPYLEKDVFMYPEDSMIEISTMKLGKKTLYIEARTEFGKKHGHLPLTIDIIAKPVQIGDSINQAPIFLQTLKNQETFMLKEGSEKQIKLPEAGDANLDDFTIEVSSNSLDGQKLSFDSGSGVINLRGIQEADLGNHVIYILLRDSKGKERQYQIDVFVMKPIVVEQKVEVDKGVVEIQQFQEKVKDEFKRPEYMLTARIESISQYGEVKVTFSANVDSIAQQDEYLQWINSTNTDIYVDPESKDYYGEQATKKINITNWKVKEFSANSIIFSLTFFSPASISPLPEQDQLVVHFKNESRELIQARLERMPLHYSSNTLRNKIRRQMADSALNRGVGSSSAAADTALKAVMVFNLALNIFFAGSMTYFVGMINALQLIIHLPIFNIPIPANVATFFEAILPIVMFDILSDFQIFEKVLDFDYDGQDELNDQVLDQFENLGYDTHNALLLLGTVGIVSLLWIMRAIFFIFVLKPILFFKKYEWAVQMHENQKNLLFFDEILTLGIEGCLSFAIAGYFNLKSPLGGFNGEEIGLPYGYFSVGLSCVFVPIALIWLLVIDKSNYTNEEFTGRWGALYHGVNVRFGSVKIQASNFLVFIARRLIFLYLGFSFQHLPIIQLLGNTFLCLFNMIYQGNFTPLDYQLPNFIETTNQVMIALISSLMFCYTEWIPDEETKFLVGWAMIAMIVLNMIFNMSFVFIFAAKQVKLIYVKYKKLLRRWYRRKKKQWKQEKEQKPVEEPKEVEKPKPINSLLKRSTNLIREKSKKKKKKVKKKKVKRAESDVNETQEVMIRPNSIGKYDDSLRPKVIIIDTGIEKIEIPAKVQVSSMFPKTKIQQLMLNPVQDVIKPKRRVENTTPRFTMEDHENFIKEQKKLVEKDRKEKMKRIEDFERNLEEKTLKRQQSIESDHGSQKEEEGLRKMRDHANQMMSSFMNSKGYQKAETSIESQDKNVSIEKAKFQGPYQGRFASHYRRRLRKID